MRSDFSSSDESSSSEESEQEVRRRQRKGKKKATPANNQASRLIDEICSSGGVIVTTYAAMRSHDKLLTTKFAYCILDEGHKIRNPDSSITLACKQIQTVHRIVLSGTVIQNNLIDLWYLLLNLIVC
jgi:DNA excision repair protein ERCC-6